MYNFRKLFFWLGLISLILQISCDNSIERRKHTAVKYFKGAKFFYMNKQYDKAIANLSHVIKLDPNNDKAYNYRGLAYYYTKRYTKAIADFSYAIKLKPNDGKLYYNRGKAYLYNNKNQEDRAIADFSHAIKLNPKDDNLYYKRGVAYLRNKQNDKAIADFSYAIKLIPNDDNLYYNRGVAYFWNDQYNKAITDFFHSIKLNPNSKEVYYFRGLAYLRIKQYDKAIADFSHALKLNLSDNELYYNRGVAYCKIKQYNKAIKDYSNAIALEQLDKKIKYPLVIIYYLDIMEICIISGKHERFMLWLKQFEKHVPEKRLFNSDLIIKLYLILINKCVRNSSKIDIEKRLDSLLEDNKNIGLNWSFDLTNDWLNNPKNDLTLKQIKYIRDLTDKINRTYDPKKLDIKNKKNTSK